MEPTQRIRLISLAWILIFAGRCFGQFETAAVLGTILDPRGNVVVAAHVTDVTHPYGNAGRNIGRSNPYYDLDLGIHKQFRLPGEGHSLEFRTEVFNTLNKTNFSPANGDRSSSSFGKITSTFPARQVQFALRLAF